VGSAGNIKREQQKCQQSGSSSGTGSSSNKRAAEEFQRVERAEMIESRSKEKMREKAES
jgi:hypothetical protein